MTPDYQRDGVELHLGDCLEVLGQLPAESVDCCCTSPPYWGLRDYGTATWEGGDAGCDHERPPLGGDGSTSGLNAKYNNDGQFDGKQHPRIQQYTGLCGKCGARRIDAQLGLESTPDEYVAKMVEVFRAVRRVLKPTATLWLNLGDSYSSGSRTTQVRDMLRDACSGKQEHLNGIAVRPPCVPGLKPKDLCGIPWRVAFALQADGWWLRQDIIWAKPNPMPESCTDRCTKSHEYVFLLTKQARYFFDAEAIKEGTTRQVKGAFRVGGSYTKGQSFNNSGKVKPTDSTTHDEATGRNKRSVWTITTQAYKEAHFATFPEKLVEPMIKAGSSQHGVCPDCGKPWTRVVERGEPVDSDRNHKMFRPGGNERAVRDQGWNGEAGFAPNMVITSKTIGWQPTCEHNSEPVPATVLDPFAGSCTTGVVAHRFGRRFIGIELSKEYCKIARKRLDEQCDSMALLEGVA